MKVDIDFSEVNRLFEKAVNNEVPFKFFPSGSSKESEPKSKKIPALLFYNTYEKMCNEIFGKEIAKTLIRIMITTGRLLEHQFSYFFGFVQDINSKMPHSEPIFPIIKGVNRSKKEKPYRDHLLHPTVVYLLGRKLLDDKQFHNELIKLIDKSNLGRDASQFADFDPSLQDWESALQMAWSVIALSHDTVCFLEPGLYLLNEFPSKSFFQKDMVDIYRQFLNCISSLINTGTEQEIIERYFIKPGHEMLKKEGKLDHGQLLAYFLLYRYYSGREFEKLRKIPIQKLAFFLILTSIFRHDQWSKSLPKDSKKDPLSIFFVLVDLVSEIRLVWNKIKPLLSDDVPYSSSWVINIWLPITKIELQKDSSDWYFMFTANKHRIKSGEFEDYMYEKAMGYGHDVIAIQKCNQYKAILKELGLVKDDEDIKVIPIGIICPIKDCEIYNQVKPDEIVEDLNYGKIRYRCKKCNHTFCESTVIKMS